MSFFRRPGDDSSSEEDSSEYEEELEVDISQGFAKDSNGTTEETIQADTTESLSLARTISNSENGAPTSVNEARDLVTASLLEELAKYRAAEELNKQAGSNREDYIAKDSPEVQRLAKEIFAKSSGVLAEVGVISAESASERRRSERARYLTSLERVSHTGVSNAATRPANMTNTHNMLVRHSSHQPANWQNWQTLQNVRLQGPLWQLDELMRRPSSDLPVMPISAPLRFNSHYRSSFIERGILGKGGFGKVFHSYNLYDRREYAIKKIPLSPKLSQSYTQGGLPALQHVLKEVQALASLEHCNIVRYHATWIEEPNTSAQDEIYASAYPDISYHGPKLLDNAPVQSKASLTDKRKPMSIMPFYEDREVPVVGRVVSAASSDPEQDDNDPFARSNAGESEGRLLWSQNKAVSASLSHADESDPFDDGRSHRRESLVRSTLLNDPTSNSYVLHVQMSMYPLTLAEYLLPISSPRRRAGTQSRHCFHVIPALRLLLGILCGLQYIHSHGYIHRDIKPGNIFLSQVDTITPNVFNLEQGYVDVGTCPSCMYHEPRFLNPRIGDFGLVAELERAATTESVLGSGEGSSASGQHAVGTQFYRPPQYGQKMNAADEKLDVFGLGVVFLELLYYCSTSTGRQMLLKGCQTASIPNDLGDQIVAEGHSVNVANDIIQCLRGMLDLNPRSRWRCAMVKNAIENILTDISSQRSQTRPS